MASWKQQTCSLSEEQRLPAGRFYGCWKEHRSKNQATTNAPTAQRTKKTRSGHVRGGGSAPPGPRASTLPHVSPKYWERRSGCGRRRSSSIDPPSKISCQSSDVVCLSKQTRSVCARLPNVSGVSSDQRVSAMFPLRIRRAEGRQRLRRGGGAGWCRRSGLGLRSVTAILQTRLVLFAR